VLVVQRGAPCWCAKLGEMADPRLESTTAHLAAAGCLDAEGEAAEMLGANPDPPTLAGWLSRRATGEPLAWILGSTVFCDRVVRVDPGVYVPRPHGEELVDRAAALLRSGGWAVDLCTGSGALAASLAARRPDAVVVAGDLDRRAARCARSNGVPVVVADLDQGFASGSVDLVLAVVPYVPDDAMAYLPRDVVAFEGEHALRGGGPDGLDLLRRLLRGAARLLRPGGWLLAELGGDQAELLRLDPAASAFESLGTWSDAEGDLRGFAAQRR